MATILGLVFSVSGLGLGALVIVERLVRPDLPVGWASLIVTAVLFSGVQLAMLGLVGENLGRLLPDDKPIPPVRRP